MRRGPADPLGDFVMMQPVDVWEAWVEIGKRLSENPTLDDERRVIARAPADARAKLTFESSKWRS